jgi:NhaA family Na+:H+ antiporter
MAAPAALYLLIVPPGSWLHEWGQPMSTDTASAVALIVMLRSRVPVDCIFVTAAAIVDDLGAILAAAIFYLGELSLSYLAPAAALVGALVMLSRSHVDRLAPYVMVGVVCRRARWQAGCIRSWPASSWRCSSPPGRRRT